MEIHLDKRAVRQIRLSANDSIEEGDTEALREDIMEAFSEEQVEDIERRLDSGDFFEFLSSEPDKEYYLALGSSQRSHCSGSGKASAGQVKPAKKASGMCCTVASAGPRITP